ncbi:NAD(P)/FAD-dependent oxidoreductase [Bailinhaonella thermotolerans]|uniref:FAD-dependent oxidoreductase n=1 Tax=Bailinhaonella thermotolerans TaxID=1070861 RepID=A0A3A4AX02_9ACTN|nr:FAD-dependent oxidoreductase [Bailinhaonella thermotolerans]RJL30363.1 FAD-dependent oxidoreductase [Bailinhaonella thermotolerans]
MGHRVVVVGASLGGLRSSEQLRAAKYDGEIVVIGDEPHMPYNRPPLSKEALSGEVPFETVELRRRKTVADVTWRLGSAVLRADLRERRVVLADGSELSYDGLVVASGLRPRSLGLPGPRDGRHVVRTLDDALRLRAALTPGARVVIVGAGFIGCEVAATAVKLGCDVEVVAADPTPMIRPLGAELGEAMRRRHEREGVRFRLGHTITEVHGGLRVAGVVLDDGTALPCDVLVEALGSLVNVEWLEGNGLDLSDGVLCDNHMRVESRPEVVAVGDVARFPNPLFDDVPRRVEHWNIPTDTAKRAGPVLAAHLRGEPAPATPFAPMPSFWSDQYGLRIQSFGAPDLGEPRVLEGDLDGEVVVGYFRGDRLVGVVAVGLLERAMHYRGEIAAQAPEPA